MRRVVLSLALFFSLSVFPAPESEFLSPFYERSDPARLESRLAELSSQSTLHAHLSTQIIELHLYLAALDDGRPHRARELLESMALLCDHELEQGWATYRAQSELRARAAYLCAWVAAERMERSSYGRFALRGKQLRALEMAREESLSATERSYLEARISLASPPGWGRDVRGALVKLVMLELQQPNNLAIRQALVRAYLSNGSPSAAQDRGVTPQRRWLDVPGYGVVPGIFAAPSQGVGLVVMAQDQRLFDRDRSLAVVASATSRGSFGAEVAYADAQVLPGSTLDASAGWSHDLRDYFPLGIDSLSASRTRNLTTVWKGEVGATVEIVAPVSLRVGWRAESRRVEETPFVVESETLSRSLSYSGPVAEIAFDNRDSARDPWRGVELRARGHFPAEGLGSPITFERWDFLTAYHLMLSRSHHLHFHASLASASLSAPLSAYPYLGGILRLPGVRSDRFRHRQSLASYIEYQFHTRGPFRAAAFFVAGRVAPTVSDLFGSPGIGGGLALLVQNSRNRSTPLRIELGNFKSEWSFQVQLANEF